MIYLYFHVVIVSNVKLSYKFLNEDILLRIIIIIIITIINVIIITFAERKSRTILKSEIFSSEILQNQN